MALTSGSRLGSYEIIAAIGAGGMGEVYRARDTKLNRDVAIKVLPDLFANDPDRLARFTREAQTLASLNHPNIASIYGIEGHALVMELVDGDDLSALIVRGHPEAESVSSRLRDSVSAAGRGGGAPRNLSKGGLPLGEALPIARQIAEALEAAHEQGIIHRDLKPANVKVRADGTVKVLDFGLAKAMEPAGGMSAAGSMSPSVSMSPTMTSPAMTQAGMILGTVAYMAPEQAKGKAVDRRADVWAFGAVLYEMLAGKRAFAGEDISDVLVSVLRDDPDWSALPDDLPASTRQVLHVCLQKDPKKRVRDMSAIRLALDGVFDAPTSQAGTMPAIAPPQRSRWQNAWLLALGAFVVGGLAASVFLWPRPVPAPLVARFVITTPTTPAFRTAQGVPTVAISPDGSRLVYKIFPDSSPGANAVLYQREIGQLTGTLIAGTEGSQGFFFSPDGNWIGFSSVIDNTLKRISVSGGPSQTICALEGQLRGASWGPDDAIVFATTSSKGLRRVAAGGGVPQVLTTVDPAGDETDHWWPEVLPGGKSVIFAAWNGTAQRSRIVALSLPSRKTSDVVRGGTYPHLSPTGHLVYAVDGELRAVRFSADNLRAAGDSVSVMEGVAGAANGAANYAIASDGSLFYVNGSTTGVPPRTLVWVDRRGRQEAINVPPRAYTYARLSPDGTRVALDARDQQNDIWIWDLVRGTLQRLTTDPGLNRGPVWAPDGARVAFTAVQDGVEGVFWQNADGSGSPERLSVGPSPEGPSSFSPDGKSLVIVTPMSGPFDLAVLRLDGERRREALLNTKFNELNGEVSRDGHWLAYDSDESGKSEVYLAPFPDVNASKRQVSTGGGTRPLWSKDGRELFYYVPPDTIMAVPVTQGLNLTLGAPAVAVKGSYALALNAGRHYDVSPDGQKFLLLVDAQSPDGKKAEPPEMRLVLHWTEELKAKLPAGK